MIESKFWTRKVHLVTTSALFSVGLLTCSSIAHAQRATLTAPAPNTEQGAPESGRNIPNGIPFQISVDGVPIDGSLGTAEDDQRTVDVALDRMDVQLACDGLKLDKAANIQACLKHNMQAIKVMMAILIQYGHQMAVRPCLITKLT